MSGESSMARPVTEKAGSLTRRRVISTLAGGTAALAVANSPGIFAFRNASSPKNDLPMGAPRLIRAFDYRGVRLLESPLQQQMLRTRDLYFNMSNDDMLRGYRRMANLPAPGP